MDVTVFTRNMEMTPRLEDYVDQKVGKLDRYLPSIDEARVDLSVENTRNAAHSQVAQLTVRVRGKILRAEERTQDIFTSIDAVLDKMYRQIARYKGRRQNRFQVAVEPLPIEDLMEEMGEQEGEIVRVKRFDLLPMSTEEAIEQMELLGHSFYIFFSADEDAVNVVYKRADGNYGLLQPQFS
ncbi:MAG TPA: ribosome-associated translation inhibitor RaiA [Chloroflexi bacterium]|mgnify:CR=1 FL=1|nr:ribosome-associated translation inhibitor RaiA [Chloroflexota bacterium]